ncbi:unannotated protein [freshwater metagenome]|uniref:Unannotated protein n=1 Tax=freshwater metagenome TaxID=449393 RepID=A0A6J7CSP9_9ZZZZ|nr:hypothetical protein [Actinomycetota bacterium]MUH57700.1 hypothetical protein [Actinomycetota bacterium]
MASEQEGTTRQRRWLAALGITLYAVFTVFSHRFDYAAIVSEHPFFHLWQLADPQLLQHHLAPTLWNLHMQPPLFNLEVGLLLHLPQGLGSPLVRLICGALYVATGLWTFKTMTRLRVGTRTAMIATIVLVYLDPAQLFFAQSVLYVGTAAALATGTAYFAVRFAQEPTPSNAAWFTGTGTLLCLYATSLQPVMLIAILAVVWWLYPATRPALKKGALVPVLVLVLLVLKSSVMFHTPMTSTWAGMNLARATTDLASIETMDRLTNSSDFSQYARVRAFSTLEQYGLHPQSGNTVRTQIQQSTGAVNYNNDAYRGISARSLSDGIEFIKRAPGQYFDHVIRGLSIWSLPSDQYFLCPISQSGPFEGYAHFYDTVVGGQIRPVRDLDAQQDLRFTGVAWSSRSPLALILTVFTLIGGMLLTLRSWRRRRAGSLEYLLPWLLVAQGFVLMNATDIGENQRFRFQLGTVFVSFAVVVATAVWRTIQRRYRQSH